MTFWKVFFSINAAIWMFYIAALVVLSIYEPDMVSEVELLNAYSVVSVILNLFSLVGLYGLAFKRPMFHKYTWIILSMLIVASEFIYANYLAIVELKNDSEPYTNAQLLIFIPVYIVGEIWLGLVLYGLYKYSLMFNKLKGMRIT